MSWDPEQYLKFRSEREKPFYDLLKLLKGMPKSIVDLGCGTGALTKVLHEAFKAESTIGIDSSETMLEKAPKADGLQFVLQDIASFNPDHKFDLIFSNAALHWLPDHKALFERLFKYARGEIAVQVPCSFDLPTHTIAKEILEIEFPSVLTIEEYSELFYRLGAKEQIVRKQVYPLILPSADDVVEWVKGSLLSAYRARLTNEEYQEFLKKYTERIRAHFKEKPVFIPFKRILLWAKV